MMPWSQGALCAMRNLRPPLTSGTLQQSPTMIWTMNESRQWYERLGRVLHVPLVDSFQRRPRHRASFHPKFAKWHLPTVITAKISIIPSSSTTPPNDASRRISISNAPNLLQPPFSFPPNDESRL
ncbi:hypothetical protein BT69DRAFT_1291393, partial [Atractiella rhizophila]